MRRNRAGEPGYVPVTQDVTWLRNRYDQALNRPFRPWSPRQASAQ
jgi:hypothetical protein